MGGGGGGLTSTSSPRPAACVSEALALFGFGFSFGVELRPSSELSEPKGGRPEGGLYRLLGEEGLGDIDKGGSRLGVEADALPREPFMYGPVSIGSPGLIHLIREGAGVSTN